MLIFWSLESAMQRICLTLSLERFMSLPISSQDRAVSPFRPKYNLRMCSSLWSNVLRSLSKSCFICCLVTMASGIVSSGPGMTSYTTFQLNKLIYRIWSSSVKFDLTHLFSIYKNGKVLKYYWLKIINHTFKSCWVFLLWLQVRWSRRLIWVWYN